MLSPDGRNSLETDFVVIFEPVTSYYHIRRLVPLLSYPFIYLVLPYLIKPHPVALSGAAGAGGGGRVGSCVVGVGGAGG